LAVPAEPEEALRGALVLRGLVRRLEEEAAGLRESGAAAQAALALAEREQAALAGAEQRARQAAEAVEAELAAARARRAAAEAAEDRAAERAQAAAAQARDLAEMVQRLERERQRRQAEDRANAAAQAAEAARRRAEEARERQEARARAARPEGRPDGRPEARPESRPGASPEPRPEPVAGRALPVAGRVATGWGEAGPGGPHRGITFAASPGARVVSPCTGRAVYAAPFRSFGLLLIVDCGGEYHFVLAGLDRLDVAAGQRLLAGEPVGLLAGPGGPGASLYVELRRGGQPVDPRPWFAGRG
jgi:septal ring factor EnvC (AmiA/AmiB activator)